MRTPPLLADFIHPGPCKPFCEKSLTLPADTRLLEKAAVRLPEGSGEGETNRNMESAAATFFGKVKIFP